MPMSVGAIHPARLPVKFCRPVHFPDVAGPASVCVTAQRFEVHMPRPMQARIRIAMAARWLATIPTSTILEAITGPAPVNVLRTRVGEAPAAIHLSESQPETSAVAANTKKARLVTKDMTWTEKWRSRSRYVGNHVMKKYQT